MKEKNIGLFTFIKIISKGEIIMKKSTMVWIQRVVGLGMIIVGAYIGIFLNEVNAILVTVLFFALGGSALFTNKLCWLWDSFDEEEYEKKINERAAKRAAKLNLR